MKQYFLSYRPRTEYGISKFFNVQDDQSWAFSETVQKIRQITHTASRFSFLVRAASVVASPQTSFGARLSRIHFSPTDVC